VTGPRRWRRQGAIWLLLAPSLAIFLLYRIVPLGWNAVLSVQKWSPLRPAEFAGLHHYEEMFLHDDVFWTSLQNTLVYMAAVAVGIIWRWLYDEKLGLINYVLIRLGVVERGIPFLDSFTWAMPAVMVATIWQMVGFFMIVLLAGLQSIPPNLHEAAAIDGADGGQRFLRITVPLLRPSLFLCLVLGIINSFTSFDLIYVMTRGGPNYATELLITYIYRAAFVLSQLDYAAALTVVLFLLLLGVTWAANRLAGGEAGAVEAAE
jgi:ABC-type sugar transport system permease subunit